MPMRSLRAQRATGRKVGDLPVVGEQAPAKGTAVAGQRAIEAVIAEHRGGRVVDQPLGALERPAAADPEQGIGGKGGIADERDAGPGGRAQHVGHIERADQLGRALGARPGPGLPAVRVTRRW